jgi:hypothetical protein
VFILEAHSDTVEAFTRSQKGSFSVGVIGIFCWHNPSGHIWELGWTQPLTNYQEYFPAEKGGGGVKADGA